MNENTMFNHELVSDAKEIGYRDTCDVPTMCSRMLKHDICI